MTDACTPTWISFPPHALPGVDWHDHAQAHRAVMGLFAPELPGTDGARRAGAGILYRLDTHVDGSSGVLVQTDQPPVLLPPVARVMTVPAAAWTFAQGTVVMARVAINPVARHTDKTGPRPRQVVRVVPEADAARWCADKLVPALEVREILNHTRATSRSRRAAGCPPRLVVDTIDVLGTVADPAALSDMRRLGIGRAKAYGCGLMTATKAP